MSDAEDKAGRDDIDAKVAARLRSLRLRQPLPAPGPDEPSDEELLRYIDGSMSGPERDRLEERIASSPYASARVGIVVEALRDCGYPLTRPEPAPSTVTRMARYVFRHAQNALTFLRGSDMPEALAPALATRGAAAAQPDNFFEFSHDFAPYAARLQIEGTSSAGFALQLELTEKGAPVDGARVTLKEGERTVESASTEAGSCAFAGLGDGRYRLEMRRGGSDIGTVHVDVLS